MFTEEYFSKWFDVIPEHDAKILWDFESFEEIKETYPNVLFGLDKIETQ